MVESSIVRAIVRERPLKILRKVGASESCKECWPWLGAVNDDGYGYLHISYSGKKYAIRAHRIVYECMVGPIPPGLCVLHRCDNRMCCNPKHLFLGTAKDNCHDMMKKGRRKDNSCSSNGFARLTLKDAAEIRRSKTQTMLLCAKYGVCSATIRYIRAGKTWRNLDAAIAELEKSESKPEPEQKGD